MFVYWGYWRGIAILKNNSEKHEFLPSWIAVVKNSRDEESVVTDLIRIWNSSFTDASSADALSAAGEIIIAVNNDDLLTLDSDFRSGWTRYKNRNCMRMYAQCKINRPRLFREAIDMLERNWNLNNDPKSVAILATYAKTHEDDSMSLRLKIKYLDLDWTVNHDRESLKKWIELFFDNNPDMLMDERKIFDERRIEFKEEKYPLPNFARAREDIRKERLKMAIMFLNGPNPKTDSEIELANLLNELVISIQRSGATINDSMADRAAQALQTLIGSARNYILNNYDLLSYNEKLNIIKGIAHNIGGREDWLRRLADATGDTVQYMSNRFRDVPDRVINSLIYENGVLLSPYEIRVRVSHIDQTLEYLMIQRDIARDVRENAAHNFTYRELIQFVQRLRNRR